MATGYREMPDTGMNREAAMKLGGGRPVRAEFLTKFAQSDRPTEAQTSILQALMLMNGKVMAQATALENSETLASVASAPFLSTPERIETLYLAALSRQPTAKERDRAEQFLQEAAKQKTGSTQKSAANNALAD